MAALCYPLRCRRMMAVRRIWETMAHPRRQARRIWLALGLVLAVLLWSYWADLFPRRWSFCPAVEEVSWSSAPHDPARGVCVHPTLYLYHPEIMKDITIKKDVDCLMDKEEDWVYVSKGKLWISSIAMTEHGQITCNCTPILFHTDFSVTRGATVTYMRDGYYIPSDIFEVTCQSQSRSTYHNIHASVAFNRDVRKFFRPLAPDSLGLDVLILGFNSLSKMTWLRVLPKTREYFMNTMGGLELVGYNVVGDGTPAALLPILTGQTEEELSKVEEGQDAKSLDNRPWIWKEFKDQGYVTVFQEDVPYANTFQHGLMGFQSPPVDHYMRPFQLSAHKFIRNSACLGSRSKSKVFLDWLLDAATFYRDRRTFIFAFQSLKTHDANSFSKDTDIYFRYFLSRLYNHNYIENTVLILMSDQGARFSYDKRSVQEKLEERLPYFAIRLPSWFEKKHPNVMKRFQNNRLRLTTPFDIHATLKDVLHFSQARRDNTFHRGISLFNEIPINRTCGQAGVAPHWCTCLAWQPVKTSCSHVQQAAELAVTAMNTWLQPVKQFCSPLSLQEVFSARMYPPNQDVLQSSDVTGVDEVLFQIAILTAPNSGRYELTIIYNVNTKNSSVNPRDISRIDKNVGQSSCRNISRPDLLPLCHCTENEIVENYG